MKLDDDYRPLSNYYKSAVYGVDTEKCLLAFQGKSDVIIDKT
jgi:hypothetical protein